MTEISIIIPVYNEQGNIEKILEKINSKIKIEKEVIVINDGSTDNTLEELKSSNCKIINLVRNSGKGFAMKEGIKYQKENTFFL